MMANRRRPAAAVSPPVPQAPAEVRADRAAAVRTKIMENLYCPLCKYPDHTRNTKVVASALGGSHGHLPGRTHADHLKIFLDEWERDEASPAGWVAKPPHYWVPPIDLWPLYEPEVKIPDVADLDVWKKIRANFGKRKKRPQKWMKRRERKPGAAKKPPRNRLKRMTNRPMAEGISRPCTEGAIANRAAKPVISRTKPFESL